MTDGDGCLARQRQVQSSGQNFSPFTHPSRHKIFLSLLKRKISPFFFLLFLSLSLPFFIYTLFNDDDDDDGGGDGGSPFSLINFRIYDFDHSFFFSFEGGGAFSFFLLL